VFLQGFLRFRALDRAASTGAFSATRCH